MPRRSAHRPAAHEGTDGQWHVWVTVGTRTDGRPKRRHIKRASRTAAEVEADRILDQVRQHGTAPRTGRAMTVQDWMDTYLDTVAARRCTESTVYDYRSKMRNWVYPRVGGKRVDRLEPEDLDALYLLMRQRNKAPSHILKVHRILSRALDVAHRRGIVVRNVARLVDSPSTQPVPVMALNLDVSHRVLTEARSRPSGTRWETALAMGLRQGECLGLRWELDGVPLVDLDAAVMHVHWQLRRQVYQHGCGGTCGRKRGAECPQRGEGGLVYRRCKGKSARSLPIPAPLVAALRTHRRRQERDRRAQDGHWPAGDAVFTTTDGRLVDPRVDYLEWIDILATAGVPRRKQHITRHTAGTLMLAQGVDVRVVQEQLGHRDIRTTQGYTQGAREMLADAAARMGAALWPGTPAAPPAKPKKPKRPKIKGARKGALRAVE